MKKSFGKELARIGCAIFWVFLPGIALLHTTANCHRLMKGRKKYGKEIRHVFPSASFL